MANVYRFTQADINACAAAGVTMKLSGLTVTDGDGFSDSDTLVATCAAGKKFTMVSDGVGGTVSSINFFGWNPVEGEYMTVGMTLSNGDTVATLKPTAGMEFTRFEVATQSAAVPLSWNAHPSSGSANTDVAFTWGGGDISAAPKAYNVVVSKGAVEVDNLTDPATTYTLNQPAGDYTVDVYDKGGKRDTTAAHITQNITLVDVLPKALYTVKASDITAITDNEINVKVNGADITTGSILRLGDVITANVSGNRKFFTDFSNHGTSINFKVFFDAEMQWLQFTLSNNDQTATFTMVDDTSGSAGTYESWNIATKQETPAVVGTNNVYKIDSTILAAVNKERFVTITGSDTPYDYGQFILSVLQFPFDIPADIILGKFPIQLADRELTTTANKVAADRIRIDLGEIIVPDTYGNMLSYANTNAIIHLPLSPSIVLDLEYVIGQTLGVYYLLDVYTGTATINITSTKLASVISSTQVNIGVRIPYMADAYTSPENTGVVAGGNNGVKIPYIELISHDAILPHGFFTVPVVDETLISGQTGYIKVDNVELVTSALGNEKAQIVSLLNSGVIIK